MVMITAIQNIKQLYFNNMKAKMQPPRHYEAEEEETNMREAPRRSLKSPARRASAIPSTAASKLVSPGAGRDRRAEYLRKAGARENIQLDPRGAKRNSVPITRSQDPDKLPLSQLGVNTFQTKGDLKKICGEDSEPQTESAQCVEELNTENGVIATKESAELEIGDKYMRLLEKYEQQSKLVAVMEEQLSGLRVLIEECTGENQHLVAVLKEKEAKEAAMNGELEALRKQAEKDKQERDRVAEERAIHEQIVKRLNQKISVTSDTISLT